MTEDRIESLMKHDIRAELVELHGIFSLKALAKLGGINYNTLLDHTYRRRKHIRDYSTVQKIRELHSTCKAKGWL